MGNSNPKPTKLSKLKKQWHSTQTQFSIASNISSQSTYSTSRPWSRSSRRRWKTSTLENPMNAAKTAWPVSMVESLFMPEFPIKGRVDETHFQILETIAKGAFGKVVKVVKKNTGRIYAMKILSKSHVVIENAVQQCKDEVSIQAMCGHHPFIVDCQFFWQSKKNLFIVTEYIPFGELLLLWKSYGRFSEDVVCLYIAELAITLDFLHNSGIIYRDLKMENILLDEDGHIQLIDFGLAKWLNLGNRARTICGTIQYMAPEVLRMETYTHASDWWSLGIIMYSLLMGHYPVDSPRDHNGMSNLVTEFNYSLPVDEFDNDVRLCVQKLLCKDPNKRLQSLHQLQWEPFMKTLDFDLVREKKIKPKALLEESFHLKKSLKKVDQESPSKANEVKAMMEMFEDFPWISAAEVF